MRCATVFSLLTVLVSATLGAPPTPPDTASQPRQIEYSSAQAAFEAGQKRGHQDGLAAGVLSRGKLRLTDGNVLLEVADAHRYSGSYSADYDRGYQSRYDAGYDEGLTAGKNGGLGWGGGFCLGFLLGLIGVIIAAVV